MKIQEKTTLIVVGVVALQCLAFLLVEEYVIVPSFLRIDAGSADKDHERVLSALREEADELVALATDYGHWDATYEFALGPTSAYTEENFSAPGFETIDIAFVGIYGKADERLHASILDSSGAYHEWNALPASAGEGNSFFEASADASTRSGLVEIESESYLVAVSRILRSDKSGPPQGYLLMGRRLDAGFWAEISKRTGVALACDPITNIAQSGHRTFASDGAPALSRTSRLAGFGGESLLELRTETPAAAAARGRSAGMLAFAILAASGGAIVLGMTKALRAFLVKPLSALGHAVAAFDPDAIMPLRLDGIARRRDELGLLANSVLLMETRLREGRRQIVDANRDLEHKVRERTQALSEANARLELTGEIVRGTSEGILVTDLKGLILEVNESMCQMSGYSREELVGHSSSFIRSDRDAEYFYADLASILEKEGRWSGELWNRRKSGEIYPVWTGVTAIKDAQGRPLQYVNVTSDISRVKEAEEKLQRLAYYDPLTGLPNRVLFMDRLGHILDRSERYAERMGLIFLDLDRFKDVNDSFGHAAGDALLVEAARRLVARTRKADTVCRLGGDEFTVILEHIGDSADAGRVAALLLEALKAPFVLAGTSIYIGASAGIAVFPDDDLSVEGLTKKADAAMYHAKAAGKGTYRYVSQESASRSHARLELESKLHRALDNGEFSLAFQPKFKVFPSDGRLACSGAEALARWKRADGSSMSPAEFIPACEETGLIMPLGTWILDTACLAAASWSDGKRLGVAVNLSMRQFDDPALPRLVEAALAKSGLDPASLQIELTETVVARDAKKAISMMSALRSIGVSIAMDDFGIGYSSLGMLGRLPIDVLKIDQSFVSELSARDSERRGGAESIVEAIVSLASGLGLKTVAEGVETTEQFLALRARGCDEVQGYLLGRPGASEAMLAAKRGILDPGA